MNHTVQELIHIARRYFPPMLAGEPGYDETPEARRRRIASAGARALYPTWTDMLRRIEARFPKDRHPAVLVQNLCMGFLAPDPLDDRCFSARLGLPVREAVETGHDLTFRVSFVVPYYSIRSTSRVRSQAYYVRMGGGENVELRETYDLAPDELPYTAVLGEEIVAAFPGHERMPPEVGSTIVPGVQVGAQMPGAATLYDCLFSDAW